MTETVKVLLLAADSKKGAGGLRLDREIRSVLDGIRKGGEVSDLELVAELAVQYATVPDALLRHSPKIVHFAAHGDEALGLVLDDRYRVRAQDLAALFTTFHDVRLVVLNACYTLGLAEELGRVVDYVVAMESDIDDESAVDFSAEFYSALAFGHTVAFAFKLARNLTKARWGGLSGAPRLLVRPGAGEWPRKEAAAPGAPEPRQKITMNGVKAGRSVNGDNRAASGMGDQGIVMNGVEAKGAVTARNLAPSGTGAPPSQDIEMSEVEAEGSVTTANDLL